MPRPELLDPQGKATLLGLQNLGFGQMDKIRIGKRIELEVLAESKTHAGTQVKEACKKLLVNPIIEQFTVEIEESAT